MVRRASLFVAALFAALAIAPSAHADEPDQGPAPADTYDSHFDAPPPEPSKETTLYLGGPPPRGMHLEDRTNTGLAWAGLGLFGASYALAAGIGGVAEATKPSAEDLAHEDRTLRRIDKTMPLLLIPVAGPFIMTGTLFDTAVHPTGSIPGVQAVASGIFALVSLVDAGVQLTGLTLFVAGLTTKRTWVVPNGVALHPWTAPGAGGLTVAGHFD
jgi:hypothetical protein